MLIDEVIKLLEKPIFDLGYTDLKVTYQREGSTNYLRVYVDKDDPVSLEDIVKVNDVVSDLLDKADLIKDSYMLDVSSFGAEKPIKVEKLEKYVGKHVLIHLTKPIKGENYIEGDIEEVTSDIVKISYKEKTRLIKVDVPRLDIDQARLAIKF